jgi:transcription-repair coupling factor (superfamily II helicase)
MNFLEDLITIKDEKKVGLVGLNDEFFSLYINKLFNDQQKSILIVTSSLFEANLLYTFLNTYNQDVLLFPMDDFLTTESIAVSPDLKITRLETINSLLNGTKKVVITHLNGYLRYLPSKEKYIDSIVKLKVGTEISRDELVKRLSSLGYEKESIVTKTGELGVRGFVIDIFPVQFEHPLRIEFFGDEIESIRYFDEDTQKTINNINECRIYPNSEFLIDNYYDTEKNNQKYLKELSDGNINSIYDYMNNPITVFKNYQQIKAAFINMLEQITEYRADRDKDFKDDYMFNLDDVKTDKVIYDNTIDNIIDGLDNKYVSNFSVREIDNFNENIDLINKYLLENISKNKTIVIAIKEFQIKSFTKYINMPYLITTPFNIIKNKINIINLELNKGFIYNDLIVLTETELFSKRINKAKYKTNFKYSTKIRNINTLEQGDYVVHSLHGIGVYNGIKTLKQGDFLKDYIEILYQGKDKLYIPVEKIELISKYTGKEGVAPKINKLGGTEWQKTKLRVKNKVKDIAEKLLKLYAIREMKQGYQFSKDSELQEMFENEFSYTPTKDQLLVTEQIKKDMESSSPMDRLVCGDVGYGKTEVAFRAMFKAVNDGKQVLYLCPTTILSNQQYESAKERFKNFPVNIALLNRFTSLKQTKQIIQDLKDKKVDIVFGTHRLLSDDVKPKDLGLLIIDEEQRFGVVHKEKIKEYKENVDVLTLTATPIPRTLQMSMTGLRSMSLIETPPVDRYPVQTYVMEENSHIIKDAVYKELSRNGQVFILYNRVETIESKKAELERLIPEAKIVIAHGQMSKDELENRMIDFIDHKYDILLCTTIIETGIDIPNVNTLIILNADYFGLSQLYQVRGRVGRSNKIAYAYLMYDKNKMLNEIAVKRLNVIKEFTELGSGFSIATRDLSIRGAGDILGSEQAGFIDNIGIELYLKILNEEVARLKGEPIEEETVKDEKPLLNVETHIDDKYVEDTDLKIEIHKKINEIDSYEKLLSIKKELEDRFGKINEDIEIYMYEEYFEKLAQKLHIDKVNQNKLFVEVTLNSELVSKIKFDKLFIEAYEICSKFTFKTVNNNVVIHLNIGNLDKHFLYYLVPLLNLILEEVEKN